MRQAARSLGALREKTVVACAVSDRTMRRASLAPGTAVVASPFSTRPREIRCCDPPPAATLTTCTGTASERHYKHQDVLPPGLSGLFFFFFALSPQPRKLTPSGPFSSLALLAFSSSLFRPFAASPGHRRCRACGLDHRQMLLQRPACRRLLDSLTVASLFANC